ncbi:MAG: hypothetical protein JWN03_7305 [Nocardia sp.]|uniref:hypothetical protein n=1 Tax=Nocardia sp. TaxID=1821 RepID=UPI002626C7FD|nr:hypothetical protein [Nocardia sp.]MCU1647030.1 hypothetical protein [Nocardia sp.]
MGRLHRPRGSAFAYIAGLMVSVALIATGTVVALWFQAHLGAPPPIIVVAQAPSVSADAVVPTTRIETTTPKVVVPPESIPAQLPDGAGYTAAPASALPDFVNRTANQYGWYGGDGVSARCDEWTRATAVGSTESTLFVVCGSYFKAYELATGTSIRAGIAARGSGWYGTAVGLSIQVTQSVLTIARNGGDPAVQAVVEWWTP